MHKIQVLIVEDSALIAADLQARLQTHNIEIIQVCDSGEEALRVLEDRKPDLILMDIQLAGALDGIDTARSIRDRYAIPIIYLSDHTDKSLVERAKKTFPVGYLAKPFNENDLVRTLEIAFSNSQQKTIPHTTLLPNHLFVKDGQAYIKLALADILYLKAERSYCKIVTSSKTYTESNNMKFVLQRLNHNSFLQVHRSYAVNTDHITGFEGNMLRMGAQTVEMSKDKRDELMERLKLIR